MKLDSNVVDTQIYGQMLEDLLLRVRQEIDLQCSIAGLPDMDQYLLHINSFYYHSFIERYLPQYQQRWQQEVKELLMLAQQQEVLETNIMSTLKRYTRLHNLLKTLLTNVGAFFHHNQQEAQLIHEETMRQGRELFLAMTDLQHQLQSLQSYLAEISPYLQDTELMKYLDQYPSYGTFLNIRRSAPSGPAIIPHQFNQAASELTYLIGLMTSDVLEDTDGREMIAREMQQRIEQLRAADGDDPLSIWISQTFTAELSLYRSALVAEPDIYNSPAVIINRLKGWHKIFHLLAVNRLPESTLSSLLFLCRIPADSLQESLRDVEFALQQLKQVITLLEHNPEPSYQVLVQIREWLAFWSPFLRSMSREAEVQQVPQLKGLLHQVTVGIAMLSNQFSMIETARRRSAYNQDQMERMRSLAESQLLFLEQLKADLDRLLAPRNIARTWKDMGVRLLKVPLQKGQVFPAEHLQLLQQARWEARPDAAQPDYTILHEEGDLFVIQVLNEEQIEIPYIILTRRPSEED